MGLIGRGKGIALVRMGCVRFFGYTGGALNVRATAVGAITLLVMMVPSVWSKSRLRLYPVLLGLVAGYVAALGSVFGSADSGSRPFG